MIVKFFTKIAGLKKYMAAISICFFSFLQNSSIALAWGGRGHSAICEAAVFLVKEEGLAIYLRNKTNVMSHLCNIPDIYWKSLGPEIDKINGPTHFMDIEVIGLKVKDIPTDYRKLISTYTGKPNQFKESSNIFSVPEEFGSNWWRAEQFFRRAMESGKVMEKSELPKNNREEQDEKLQFNKAAYEMTVNMGLMGHYIADNAQPFHNTSDYDGYASNHGGLHYYFETASVAQFDGDLTALILKKARSMKKTPFLNSAQFIENMKALSEISVEEIRPITKVDPVTVPSTLKIEKGVSFKVEAERASPKIGWAKFNKMITEEMARAALLLAHSWDKVYVDAGRPKLTSYKSYKFPFTPEFVAPDYFDLPTDKSVK